MKNRWIIPDIHGCLKTLKALVEENIRPTQDDELFFLGDYIDRGPDSKGVIDYIISLQERGIAVECIIGNHEDYCLNAWEADQKKRFLGMKHLEQKEWEKHGALKTLRSFGVKSPSQIPEKYINWIRSCKPYIELEHYFLVHAGMNFNIEDPLTDTRAMMWVREFMVDMKKTKGKKIIHGHIPIDLDFINQLVQLKNYSFVALDNGVYYSERPGYGNLLAFNPDTDELLIQPNIDF